MNVQNDPFDMNEARIGALDATAEAIQKIKVQYTKSQEYGLDCVKTLEDAVSSAEDTMFYLASASSDDDDDRLSEILSSYGLEDILGGSASGN